MTTTDRPRTSRIIAALAALAGLAGPSLADTPTAPHPVSTAIVKKLAPGVTWTQEIDGDPPLIVDVVTVDLTAPGVKTEVGLGQDGVGGSDPTSGREDVSRYARRHHALVAVNGDFFPYTNDPLGIGIHNGELFSEPWTGQGKGGPREVLGIDTDERRALIDKLDFDAAITIPPDDDTTGPSMAAMPQKSLAEARSPLPPIIVRGVNRQVGYDEVVVMTPLFRGATVNRPNGTDVVLTGVNLPLQLGKIMRGTVVAIHTTPDGKDDIPPNGVLLVGGPRKGASMLTAMLHPGQEIRFILDVAKYPPDTRIVNGLVKTLLVKGGSTVAVVGDSTASKWTHIDEALGGGPRLLTNGNVDIDSAADGFDPGFVDFPNPRTAVGLSADGHKMIIATVDGRQSISKGVSLPDLAVILKRYGAVNAMNLDGGGSTVMAVDGLTVDSPGGSGFERPVADMLVVYSNQPSIAMPDWDPAGRAPQSALADPPGQHFVVEKESLEEGQSEQITLFDGSRRIDPTQVIWQGPVASAPAKPIVGARGGRVETPSTSTSPGAPAVRPPDVVPTTLTQVPTPEPAGPIGFVDQHGLFTALHAGDGIVTALYRGKLLSTTIDVTPKPVALNIAMIRAVLSKGINGSDNTNILAIHVVTPDGAPIANAALRISVTAGAVDKSTVTTDADGAATVTVTWTAGAGGAVTVEPSTTAGANAGLPTMLSVTVGQ